MVAFRGDYVHGGAFYDRNHTRIFMGLTLAEDLDINTTHLEVNNKNTAPPEIKRGGENGGKHAKNGGKKKKTRKA
jgi:hypothetical protein